MKKWLIGIFLVLILFPGMVKAKSINLYLFYGEGCPHCHDEQEYLNEFLKNNQELQLYKYEVWGDKTGQQKFKKAQEVLKTPAKGVPYLVIGDQVISGYLSGITDKTIRDTIDYYQENSYRDVLGIEFGLVKPDTEKYSNNNEQVNKEYEIPVIGKFDPKNVSLLLLGLVMGLVDGFNPCAMWILLFLISMLFGMKDQKKMWILGFSFLIASALTYFLFMISWLNLAMFLNGVAIIRIIIAIVAMVLGIVNLYRYFKTKEAGCEVVNDSRRKKIINRIKTITTNKTFVLSLLGIIVLAVGVNIIELFCSLGLPVIYTEVLSMNELSEFQYILYILWYILFFLLDDIIIFVIAMKTLKIKAISNKYMKYSHLIGGLIMFVLGVLMIVKPEWLFFNF